MRPDYSKFEMDFQPGATEEEIQELINISGGRLPPDYLDFLRFSNGAFGTLVYIYPIREVIKYAQSEWIKTDIPGLLVIGSNGGDEAYGYNLNLPIPEIVMTPFIGGEWDNAVSIGTSFLEFLIKALDPQASAGFL
jgi:hypothetical protein